MTFFLVPRFWLTLWIPKFIAQQLHWLLGKSFQNLASPGSKHRKGESTYPHKSHQKNVQCFVWKDRKPVNFVNTICDYSSIGMVSRKLGDGSSIDVACPTAIKLYNQNMGGVDLANQLWGAYTCSRKSRTRWYMHLFWFFLDLSIINAYILESVSPNHVPPIAKTGQQKKRCT